MVKPIDILRELFGRDTKATDKISLEGEGERGRLAWRGRLAFTLYDGSNRPRRSGITPAEIGRVTPAYGYEGLLAISTGHMPGEDADFGGEGGPRAVEFKHGWIVFVTHDCEGLPDWLAPIMKYAIELQCTLILFDADCNKNPDFKEYDW